MSTRPGRTVPQSKPISSDEQIQQIKNENMSSLDRSLAAASHGIGVGSDTLQTLGKQREQCIMFNVMGLTMQ